MSVTKYNNLIYQGIYMYVHACMYVYMCFIHTHTHTQRVLHGEWARHWENVL